MSYVLIHDQKQVEIFERLFYSQCNGEYERVFLTYMATKKKYCDRLSNNGCFKRTVLRYEDEGPQKKLVNAIRNYEIPLGTYKDQRTRNPIPQEALALYTSVNPRNAIHATQSLTSDILDKAFSDEKKYFSHVDQQFKNKLQKYAVKQYIGIDLDTKDEEIYKQIMTDITEYVNVYVVIETRGGYHIIIPKRELQRTTNGLSAGHFLYTRLSEKYEEIDKISSDLFSPIPGTYQGGFPVKFRDC